MSVAPRLVVESVDMAFGGVKAVDDVSFSVKAGEIVGLVGPNGAGKTTLINVVSGFVRPTGGSVHYDGHEVTGRKPFELARLGLVRTFQHAHVFDLMSVGETMAAAGQVLEGSHKALGLAGLVGRRRRSALRDRRAAELLERFDLGRWVDRPARDLPYGLKKRLGVCVALMNDPSVILLDEPAAGLNSKETDRLASDVAGLRDDGYGIVIVEHNMALIMAISDRLVVLNYGKKIADGTPAEVANDSAVIGAYLGGA